MIEPLPPGETGTELTGAAAIGALQVALGNLVAPPRLEFHRVRAIAARASGRWVVVTLKFDGADANEVTFRIGRSWASVLRQRLNQVLA